MHILYACVVINLFAVVYSVDEMHDIFIMLIIRSTSVFVAGASHARGAITPVSGLSNFIPMSLLTQYSNILERTLLQVEPTFIQN